MSVNSKITHCIWSDSHGKEMAKFYTGIFKDSEIGQMSRYDALSAAASGNREGDVMTVSFRIENLEFMVLNGGSLFRPNPALSFFIHCENGENLDHYWSELSRGGTLLMPLQEYPFSKRYGWIQDKYGVSWQIMHTDPAGDWRPKLVPCLLFTRERSGRTKEAVEFYLSVFEHTERGQMIPADDPGTEGKTIFSDFMIEGQWWAAMDSPQEDAFEFSEGNSLVVHCRNQKEIDYFWQKLTEDGGEESKCGWLKDKFGVSWQIVPEDITELLSSSEAVQALMQMGKIDVEKLKRVGK